MTVTFGYDLRGGFVEFTLNGEREGEEMMEGCVAERKKGKSEKESYGC